MTDAPRAADRSARSSGHAEGAQGRDAGPEDAREVAQKITDDFWYGIVPDRRDALAGLLTRQIAAALVAWGERVRRETIEECEKVAYQGADVAEIYAPNIDVNVMLNQRTWATMRAVAANLRRLAMKGA